VVSENPDCPEILLARLGKGQYFGEVELMQRVLNRQRAASQDCQVELRLLPKQEFYSCCIGSPPRRKWSLRLPETPGRKPGQNGGCE
jgi:hypothetical protein